MANLFCDNAHAEFGKVAEAPATSKKLQIISKSTYLPMRDGVRIAIDYIYSNNETAKYPTIVWFTRYWRSLDLYIPAPPGRVPINSREELPEYFLRHGYAIVFVDVRGTGASEGVWSMPWSADERNDFGEVLRWISRQPWSNGKVAAMGLSYEASTALFAATGAEHLLSAVVAQQFEFDVYTDVAFPGGIFNDWFVKAWTRANDRLDHNKTAEFFPWYARLLVKGVRPVNGDAKSLAALIATRHNNDVYQAMHGITYRDDVYGSAGITIDDFSLHTHRDALERSDVPIFSWGSWVDGATADSVIRSYINLTNPHYAVIGAWDHMTQRQGSAYGDTGGVAVPDQRHRWGEMLQFVNDHLVNSATASPRKQLLYYTMGEEKWKRTETWPPANVEQTVMYLANEGVLQFAPPSESPAFDSYKVDFAATTGTNNRWHTELAKKVNYGNRAKHDRRLLTYTSEPLTADMEITGYPIVELFVQSSERDGAFYVYLEDVDARGRVTYVTDGQLRALHRKLATETPPYHSPAPYRTYKRGDAMFLVENEIAHLTFAMQPTSVLIRRGHRIRIAIAGHDKDTFARIPETGDPVIRVFRGGASASKIYLPVKPLR